MVGNGSGLAGGGVPAAAAAATGGEERGEERQERVLEGGVFGAGWREALEAHGDEEEDLQGPVRVMM